MMRPLLLQPAPHSGVGVVARVDVLLDPGQQEDLVVHGQAEAEGEDEHHDERAQPADGERVQRPGQPAVFEDGHQHAEGGAEGDDSSSASALIGTTTRARSSGRAARTWSATITASA